MNCPVWDMCKLIRWTLIGLLRSRASLEAEILALRHQLNVLQRSAPKRCVFSNFDRLIFTSLYRITADVLAALTIVNPQTVLRWHRAGFRLFWRWKSRSRGGRPKTPLEIPRPGGASLLYDSSSGLLQLSNGAGQAATLDFQNSTLGAGAFQFAADGSGGMLLTHA
jgi:hypothetical protein